MLDATAMGFHGSTISTVRCHTDLGSYSLTITHRFSFRAAAAPVRAHCPGAALRRALEQATRADLSSDDLRLTLSDDQGSTVVVLECRRG